MDKQEKLAKMTRDIEADLSSYGEQLTQRFGRSQAVEALEAAMKVILVEAGVRAIENKEDSTLVTEIITTSVNEVVGRYLGLIHIASYLTREIGKERTKELIEESSKDSDEFLRMVAHAVDHAMKHFDRAIERS